MHRPLARMGSVDRNPRRLTNQPGFDPPALPLTKMTITITREIEITVEARIIPGTRATLMQPADPADIEILEAHIDGNIIELTDAEIDEVREMALND